MICPPCAETADMDRDLPSVLGGHPPETCRDAAIQPHGCTCAHRPVGSATARKESPDA